MIMDVAVFRADDVNRIHVSCVRHFHHHFQCLHHVISHFEKQSPKTSLKTNRWYILWIFKSCTANVLQHMLALVRFYVLKRQSTVLIASVETAVNDDDEDGRKKITGNDGNEEEEAQKSFQINCISFVLISRLLTNLMREFIALFFQYLNFCAAIQYFLLFFYSLIFPWPENRNRTSSATATQSGNKILVSTTNDDLFFFPCNLPNYSPEIAVCAE